MRPKRWRFAALLGMGLLLAACAAGSYDATPHGFYDGGEHSHGRP